MKEFNLPLKNKEVILALGAESAGNFSICQNGKLHFSQDFGDLLIDENFNKYKKELNTFLKKFKIIPTIILSDLHPQFRTTELAQKLAENYKAQHVPVQHHLAHIFSAFGDRMIHDSCFMLHDSCLGIACDGTGYGLDGKIWGGEIFEIRIMNHESRIMRVGHLENQILIGGQKAIEEPARVLISILSKIPNSKFQIPNKSQKDFVFDFVKKYYSKNEFEVLWNQLSQNFNCLETSSTARVLDAVSVLLGFSKNERLEKHGPVQLLEQNSTVAYSNLKPKVLEIFNEESGIMNYELCTTHLFKYLIKNIDKDKSRLAATAQKYLADGLIEIIKRCHPELVSGSRETQVPNEMLKQVQLGKVFFAGGMANNPIMAEILESRGVYANKKIPRGDAGISFGQIFCYLLANSRN